MSKQETQIMPPTDEVLSESLFRIKAHAVTIHKIEQDADRKKILPRLLIGLHCLKAHSIFALKDANRKGVGGRGKKNSVTRDAVSIDSYESWLESSETNLKKSTTYKYMTALRGLGCDENSTEHEVTTVLKTYSQPTIAGLIAAATDPLNPPEDKDEPREEQLEFEMLRTDLSDYREAEQRVVNNIERIKAYPVLLKAATARAYATLFALTGEHWQPSDEAHELSEINPDAVEL